MRASIFRIELAMAGATKRIRVEMGLAPDPEPKPDKAAAAKKLAGILRRKSKNNGRKQRP